MSIRPVDLQVMLPRTTELTKVASNDSQRPEVMHQQFTERIQKQAEHDEQRVINTNKSEQNAVDADGRGNSGKDSSKKRRGSAREQENEKNAAAKSRGMFDVTI